MVNFDSTILQTIKQANRILVVADILSTPSNGAAAMALVSGLVQAGRQADLVANSVMSEDWSMLMMEQPSLSLASEDFVVSLDLSRTKVGQIKYKIEGDRLNFLIKPNGGQFTEEDVELIVGRPPYDLIITIGAAEPGALGEIYDNNSGLFYQTPVINIDCQSSNENFGQINLVDLVASSTAEIIYNLYRAMEWSIDANQATGLLAGLIYDTKNFTNSKASPQVLLAAANLIKQGARREEIVNRWYASVELNTLRLWGKILLNLEQSDNGLVWSKLESEGEPVSGVMVGQAIDRLLAGLSNTKLVVIFYDLAKPAEPTVSLSLLKSQESLKEVNKSLQQGNDRTGVVVYSNGPIDVKEWLKEFDPNSYGSLVSLISNLSVSSTMELILPILNRRLAEIE
jgi:nanoRNase/pAp phosphatase (c-di-AMP/oligoRNAs hydrolase)